MVHPTLEYARKVTDDICRDAPEQRAKIAAYAFERQVCIFHAAWAVWLRDGAELGACGCAKCERDGINKRIGTAAAHARRRFTTGLRDEFGRVERIKGGRPDWWIEANEVSRKAANAEALAVLAELEAAA